jgi:FkbM family methyltransferase
MGLNALLEQPRQGFLEVEASRFDQLSGRDEGPIVLFGAGGLGRKTLRGLAGTGLEPLCFADNAEAAQGTVVEGLPVLSAAEAVARYGDTAIFVVTAFNHYEQIVSQLRQLGAATIVPFFVLFWKYPDRYLPEYSYDLPHLVIDAGARIREAAELLADEPSRVEYEAQVAWRLDPMAAVLPDHTNGDMYFPHDLVALRHDEVFVDCGGYDGDTLKDFVRVVRGQFKDAFVYEPDPRNLLRLERAIDAFPDDVRSRVHLGRVAIGKESGSVGLQLSDAASSIVASGDLTVPCEPLDLLLEGRAPTYMKMDIEGAEVDALMGSRDLISADRPVLALSAYHLQDHLWTIPLLVNSFVDGYRYHYRRYGRQPNDDLVLYAIPEERWKGGSAEPGPSAAS